LAPKLRGKKKLIFTDSEILQITKELKMNIIGIQVKGISNGTTIIGIVGERI
jgi:hypothetical protein